MSNLVGDNVAKLNALMQQAVRPLAKYINKAFEKRREALYVSKNVQQIILITNFHVSNIYNSNVILYIYTIYMSI